MGEFTALPRPSIAGFRGKVGKGGMKGREREEKDPPPLLLDKLNPDQPPA